MLKITPELCITKYIELKNILGHQPGSREFYEKSGISQRQVRIAFRTFTKLVQAAGDISQLPLDKKFPRKLDEELFEKYALIVRELKKHPSTADWLYYQNSKPALALSSERTYRRLGRWSNMPMLFQKWAADKFQYHDVLNYLGLKEKKNDQIAKTSDSISFEDYIPPIIQNIEKVKDSLEFENKVTNCFQLLGFKVDPLGQGQGQNPDGIASRPKDSYAIIYDAKSHQEGYSISASDRRAAEQYIDDHRGKLERDGIKTLLFTFVARSFNSDCLKAIQGIREKTNVTTVLLPISSLIRLTTTHIQNPYDFDFLKLKNLLSKGGQIDPKIIQPFLDDIIKQSSI
jgi:hypothetical protein